MCLTVAAEKKESSEIEGQLAGCGKKSRWRATQLPARSSQLAALSWTRLWAPSHLHIQGVLDRGNESNYRLRARMRLKAVSIDYLILGTLFSYVYRRNHHGLAS